MRKSKKTFYPGNVSTTLHDNRGAESRTFKRDVPGLISDHGVGIIPRIGGRGYSVIMPGSGQEITYALSKKEALEKAERLHGVTNWNDHPNPDSKLSRKAVDAILNKTAEPQERPAMKKQIKEPVSGFKKGTFNITREVRDTSKPITKAGGSYKQIQEEKSGYISTSGLGIYGSRGSLYTLTHLKSGRAIRHYETLTEAKAAGERIGSITNWKRTIYTKGRDKNLGHKIIAAERGEVVPKHIRKNQHTDEYDVKAHARRGGHIVEDQYARSYKGQQRTRGEIHRELTKKHIAYKIDVTNTTKGRKIK